MAIVEFNKDCYPYCKGDRIQLDEEEMKTVDVLAKERQVSKPYTVVEDPSVPTITETIEAVGTVDQNAEPVRPVESQAAAEANLAAPGVEAVLELENERQAKVAAKKSK